MESASRTTLASTTAFDEDVFNNLSLLYRKKEYKFIKSYEYYMSMRSKELGLVNPNAQDDEDDDNPDDILNNMSTDQNNGVDSKP